MMAFERTVLWIGRPSYLVVVAGLAVKRIVSVEPGPDFPDGDTNVLSGWLATRLERGRVVDVVYLHHLLRIEAFTGVNVADLRGAMKLRLKKDALISVDGLQGLYVPLQAAGGKAQCVFAGTLTSLHTTVCQVIEAAGARPGRVGFAGQLALRALIRRCPRGGWSVLEDIAAPGRLLLAVSAEGQAAAAGYPADGVDLVAAGPDIVRLNLPRSTVEAAAPQDMGTAAHDRAAVAGAPLPGPLAYTLPVLLNEKTWRVPSADDVRYPYFLAPQTWAFLIVMVGVLIYTALLGDTLRRIRASAPELARLDAEKKKLAAEQSEVDRRTAALGAVSGHVGELSAEPFDNGAWLQLLGVLRDRHAPTLLFDRFSVRSSAISVVGRHDAVQQILLLVKYLTRAVGEDSVRMGSFNRAADGQVEFSLEIDRKSARPPKLEEAGT
jgi:hypothetical protein